MTMYGHTWCKANDEKAQDALRAAGIWYSPPHKPPPVPVNIEALEPPEPPEQKPQEPPGPPPPPFYVGREKIRAVLLAVSRTMSVPVEVMRGPTRTRNVVHARWVAIWILRNQLGYAYPRIGRLLNKDHSSVVHAMNKIDEDHIAIAQRVSAELVEMGVLRPFDEAAPE